MNIFIPSKVVEEVEKIEADEVDNVDEVMLIQKSLIVQR